MRLVVFVSNHRNSWHWVVLVIRTTEELGPWIWHHHLLKGTQITYSKVPWGDDWKEERPRCHVWHLSFCPSLCQKRKQSEDAPSISSHHFQAKSDLWTQGPLGSEKVTHFFSSSNVFFLDAWDSSKLVLSIPTSTRPEHQPLSKVATPSWAGGVSELRGCCGIEQWPPAGEGPLANEGTPAWTVPGTRNLDIQLGAWLSLVWPIPVWGQKSDDYFFN